MYLAIPLSCLRDQEVPSERPSYLKEELLGKTRRGSGSETLSDYVGPTER
jgi:hypothetical protein